MRSRMLPDLSSSGVLSLGFVVRFSGRMPGCSVAYPSGVLSPELVARFPESSVSADALSSPSSIRMHRAAAALTMS